MGLPFVIVKMVGQEAAKEKFDLAMLVQNTTSNKFPAACRYKATEIFCCFLSR